MARKVRHRCFGPPRLDKLGSDGQGRKTSKNANRISADRNPPGNHRHGENKGNDNRDACNQVFMVGVKLSWPLASIGSTGLTRRLKIQHNMLVVISVLVVIVVRHEQTPAK